MNRTTRRAAIYARISTDKQNPLSPADQERKCREYADRNSITVLDTHVYVDEGLSGVGMDRPSLQQLLRLYDCTCRRIRDRVEATGDRRGAGEDRATNFRDVSHGLFTQSHRAKTQRGTGCRTRQLVPHRDTGNAQTRAL